MSAALFACEIHDTGRLAEHTAAHRLLHQVLAIEYGITSPIIERDGHGKPFLPGMPSLHFNLSHCAGLAVCVVGSSPLGVDAEIVRPLRENVLRRSFSKEEAEAIAASDRPNEMFFRHWTLKESFVKAIGIGISYPLHTVCFSLDENGVHSNQPDWQFTQFMLRDTWIISCCVSAKEHLPQNIQMTL